jgi:hypothetical protein
VHVYHSGFFPDGFIEFLGLEERYSLLCGSPFDVALLNALLLDIITGSSFILNPSPGTRICWFMLAAFSTVASGNCTGDKTGVAFFFVTFTGPAGLTAAFAGACSLRCVGFTGIDFFAVAFFALPAAFFTVTFIGAAFFNGAFFTDFFGTTFLSGAFLPFGDTVLTGAFFSFEAAGFASTFLGVVFFPSGEAVLANAFFTTLDFFAMNFFLEK